MAESWINGLRKHCFLKEKERQKKEKEKEREMDNEL